RAKRLVRNGSFLLTALYVAVTALTFAMQVPIRGRWLFAMPPVSLLLLVGLWLTSRTARTAAALVASSSFVVSLLVAAAGTLFPYLLPAFPAGSGGISIFDATPSAAALNCALSVTLLGIVAVAIYSPIVWRRMSGKIRVE
ncbi:MAG: cytochrome d ubiquinol oxidase subunit II, partial [Candidatus Eremiobacteraeota bacterium]|nr:cytochrome d ubiquinol oxidase subunit II [Candidatus Eremiobacteraeota bacterium]